MGEYVVGKLYRAGPGGVVITWADGSTTAYSAHELIYLKRTPLTIRGRIFRSRRRHVLEYEAPALVPER
jgi:hypothetical protein